MSAISRAVRSRITSILICAGLVVVAFAILAPVAFASDIVSTPTFAPGLITPWKGGTPRLVLIDFRVKVNSLDGGSIHFNLTEESNPDHPTSTDHELLDVRINCTPPLVAGTEYDVSMYLELGCDTTCVIDRLDVFFVGVYGVGGAPNPPGCTETTILGGVPVHEEIYELVIENPNTFTNHGLGKLQCIPAGAGIGVTRKRFPIIIPVSPYEASTWGKIKAIYR